MSWKLVNDTRSLKRGRLVDLGWVQATAMMACGTLRVTIDVARNERRPFKIISFKKTDGWPRSFEMYHNADGSVSVEHTQGDDRRYVRVSGLAERAERLQISYCWDAPERAGALAVEYLETGAIARAEFENPFPILATDAVEMSAIGSHCQHDSTLQAVTLADDIRPIGPAPGIAAGTKIMTSDGYRAIENLRPGDMVLTERNGPQAIRFIVSEDCPSVGPSLPVKLRAPYFGLGADVVVSSCQHVQLPSAHADYLLGRDRVLVEAGQLLMHSGAEIVDHQATTKQFQLLLDQPDCIDASGMWVESLYVGQLARAADILPATHFADLSGTQMPTHDNPTCAPLSKYEAQSLIDDMVA